MYNYSEIGAREITNLYLYGSTVTPVNLADEGLSGPLVLNRK